VLPLPDDRVAVVTIDDDAGGQQPGEPAPPDRISVRTFDPNLDVGDGTASAWDHQATERGTP